MHRPTHSTSSQILAAIGKGKEKLPLESPAARRLLSDCNVAPGQVQRMKDGTPLINSWVTVVEGKAVAYCHSVKTNDDKTYVRDFRGEITTLSGGRDEFIGNLLQLFLAQERRLGEDAAFSGTASVPSPFQSSTSVSSGAEMSLLDRVIQILAELPNTRAVDIASELSRRSNHHYDKTTVNKLLYGSLGPKVIKDSDFRWRLRDGVTAPSVMARKVSISPLGGAAANEVGDISFDQLMRSDTPYKLVTDELWDRWVALLKSSEVRLNGMRATADRLDLYWPSFLGKKTIADYLDFTLYDICETKDPRLGKVIFLCIAGKALDLILNSSSRSRTDSLPMKPGYISDLSEKIAARNSQLSADRTFGDPIDRTTGAENPDVSFYRLMEAETPHCMVSDEQWNAWVATLEKSPARLQRVRVVADKLDLYWPPFFATKVISDYLHFKLADIADIKEPRIQRVVFLCLCREALDLNGQQGANDIQVEVGLEGTTAGDEGCDTVAECEPLVEDLSLNAFQPKSAPAELLPPSTAHAASTTSEASEGPSAAAVGCEIEGHQPSVSFEDCAVVNDTGKCATPVEGESPVGLDLAVVDLFDGNEKLSTQESAKLFGDGEEVTSSDATWIPASGNEPSGKSTPPVAPSDIRSWEATPLTEVEGGAAVVIGEGAEDGDEDVSDGAAGAVAALTVQGFDEESGTGKDTPFDQIKAGRAGEESERGETSAASEESVALGVPESGKEGTREEPADVSDLVASKPFDGRQFAEAGLLFLEPDPHPGVAGISWHLIPYHSILERTPLELFKISGEKELQVTAWLEKLPAEMIPNMSGPARLLLAGLDLLTVASCTISWLLAHCGATTTEAALQEISRIVVECAGVEGPGDAFWSGPFIDEQALFYLLETMPEGVVALFDELKSQSQVTENAIITISESAILDGDFSAGSLTRVARFYSLSSKYLLEAPSFLRHSLHPGNFLSLSDLLRAWSETVLTEGEALAETLRSGWADAVAPMRGADIARTLGLSTQGVSLRLQRSVEKLSRKSSLALLQELFFGMFSETCRHDGICTANELLQGLSSRFGWTDPPQEKILCDLYKRFGGKTIIFENGWSALRDRSFSTGNPCIAERWRQFDADIPSNSNGKLQPEVEGPAELHAEVLASPSGSNVPEDAQFAHETETGVLEPERELEEHTDGLCIHPSHALSAWHLAEALLARCAELGLRASKHSWSIAELCLNDADYRRLREWGDSAVFSTRLLQERKRVGLLTCSGREAIALVFIAFAAEVARREASEGEIWPAIYRSLGGGARDFLMILQGLNNPSPRPWLKTELERVFRSYDLRHGFDSAGTHAYVRSIALQYGFTQKNLMRIPWWLCGQQVPVAVEELTGKGPNRCTSFVELWNAFKELRWKGISRQEFASAVTGNPWLPPVGLETVIRAVTSRAHLLRQGEDMLPGAALSASLLAPPRLAIVDGRPSYEVHLEEVWPESYLEPSFVLAFGSDYRIAATRQPDGGYALAGGPLLIDPVRPTIDVSVLSGGNPVLEEPIRYPLWNEEEEFTFYGANGYAIAEGKIQAERGALFLLCAADIELSAPADRLYALFGGKAHLHQFRKGLPAGFSLSLGGEPFWSVPEGQENKRRGGGAVVDKVQGVSLPVNAAWGTKARIRLNRVPQGMEPRRLLIGEMRLLVRGSGTSIETEPFPVPPGIKALPARGVLFALEGGELRRITVEIVSTFSGVALETAGGWITPDPRRILDKADLQARRLLAIPHESEVKEWAYTEGERFLGRPSSVGDQIGQELVGLGAPLCLRKGPYNATEKPIEISRAVIDSGVLGPARRIERGWSIALRQDLDLSDDFQLHAWYPEDSLPVVIGRQHWTHDPETRSLLLRATETVSPDDPCSISLSFLGTSVGRTWCGHLAFHDLARIVSTTSNWRETAAWLAWWQAPVLADEIREAVGGRVRTRTADTLAAWVGLVPNPEMPHWMKDVTLKMKVAIRHFLHDDLPETHTCAETLLALGLLSGDWYEDDDEAWERHENLLEISPVLMAHLVKVGTHDLYGARPERVAALLQRLRCRIAGIPETDSATATADLAEVERGLLQTGARVMGVDDQFLTRAVLEESRRILRAQECPVRNLNYCLDIQPVRDWIALRLLA
ncbi:hypothetical protein GMLC_10640 [Geomonas limicola]|uniref:Uncharacterized protein n=1 Tax=Geomonas limicola TaxID=2740186 RepID=A0A6V8N4L4_9BACT|nr:hypothetical protein [Geomonas limicola]GFO67485.1 hypothetical protein GMLC_10640 [Geomonas limicola]